MISAQIEFQISVETKQTIYMDKTIHAIRIYIISCKYLKYVDITWNPFVNGLITIELEKKKTKILNNEQILANEWSVQDT